MTSSPTDMITDLFFMGLSHRHHLIHKQMQNIYFVVINPDFFLYEERPAAARPVLSVKHAITRLLAPLTVRAPISLID